MPRKTQLEAFRQAIADDLTGRAALATYWTRFLLEDLPATIRRLDPLVRDADAVVAHGHSIGAYVSSYRYGKRRVAITTGPAFARSRAYPPGTELMTSRSPLASFLPGAGQVNDRAWTEEAAWAAEALDAPTNALLAELGAPQTDACCISLPTSATAHVMASEPAFMDAQPDWPSNTVLTAYPYWDEITSASDAELTSFLDSGKPPIVVSFGTAVASARAYAYRVTVATLRELGERVVVLGAPEPLPGDSGVVSREYAPLSTILHRCRAVIHQGGPGVIYAAMRATIPSVVVPCFGDQPLNAAWTAHLGAGVFLAPRNLDRDNLTSAIASLDQLDRSRFVQLAHDLVLPGHAGSVVVDAIEQAIVG